MQRVEIETTNGVIYKITNKINGKIYIGQTIQNVKERFYQHCAEKCEIAVSNMAIHKAIKKYGKQNFTLEVVETVNKNYLNEREIYWIQKYNSYDNGYNSTKGGQFYKSFKDLPTNIIINEYIKGKSLREIGKLINVDKQTIKRVLLQNNVSLRKTRTYKLTQEQRKQIIQEIYQGYSRKDIINKWGISKSYLCQLIKGQRRI